ncbi:MAG TPA: nucleoside deaminase [Opitutaceae bacterium]|nr:nucleoside deaminase [Opitutaceae bacterium]
MKKRDLRTQEEIDQRWLRAAIRLAREHMKSGRCGPFGAVVTRNNRIVGMGWNRVVATGDPTAHAEIVALRDAAKRLRTFRLTGCVLYSSCEPCPMCLGAAYWARVARVVFGADRFDAQAAGFDDAVMYEEYRRGSAQHRLPVRQVLHGEARAVLKEWQTLAGRVMY